MANLRTSRNKFRLHLSALFVSALLLGACTSGQPALLPLGEPEKITPGPKATQSYYARSRVISKADEQKWFDANGVVNTTYKGKRVTHPVDSAWNLMVLLDSYETSGDEHYWQMIMKNYEVLMAITEVDEHGARWFPYEFEHSRGQFKSGSRWVSGMSQGMMLSVISRMYDTHPSEELKTTAHEIFKSFQVLKRETGFWFTEIVPCGGNSLEHCISLEEYPFETQTQVVNGHIYSMFGIHDYWRMTKDPQAWDLLLRSGELLKHKFNDYRRPGKPSWYAMTPFGRKTWGAPESYHVGVTRQLEGLGEITGDQEYLRMAKLFEKDYTE